MYQRMLLALLFGFTCFVPLVKAQDKKPADFKWETLVEEESRTVTKRARVPGGWLYKVQNEHAIALTFVPDRGFGFGGSFAPPEKKPRFEPGSPDEAPKPKARPKPTEDKPHATPEDKFRFKSKEKPDPKHKDDASLKEREAARAEALQQRRRAVEALQSAEAAKAEALRAKSLAETAQAKEEVARLQALAARKAAEAAGAVEQKLRTEAEKIAQVLREKLETSQLELKEARESERRALAEKEKAVAELRKVQAELEAAKKEAQRLKKRLDKGKGVSRSNVL